MIGKKLGRKAVKTDTRTLMLTRYLMPSLPPPPDMVDWSCGFTDFGMMKNDQLGCCTIAGAGHAVQVWTANLSLGTMQTISDAEVVGYYEKWDGYDPNDPSTDQGGVELNVLRDWKNSDFAGHKILGFADADIANLREVKQTIHLFGGTYIGFQVPAYVMDADVWDIQRTNDHIVGGHCVYVLGYDEQYFYLISWGKIYKMTYAFWAKYVDESHAILSADWFNEKGAPNGFNLAQLQQDIALIR